MAFQLVVVEGPDVGRAFSVDDGQKLTIGRGEKSDTRLDDATVSRVHCEVARHGNTVTISDLGSSSGTLVDGHKVDQAEIKSGSLIQIGDSLLRLTLPKTDGETTMAPGGSRPVAKPLEKLVGSSVGSYRIDEIIGRGLTGMVFKAFDTEKDRVAAIKILTPTFSRSEEQRNRFVRAMKTMLPIKDEHIVRLFNAGITGPYCWAAMEYVEGENLAQLIERLGIEGMLDWKKVWRVAMHIGQALQAGFKNKVIHRNVTPTNILRRSSDEACLLGDFMLAKAIDGKLAQQVTQPGQLVGEVPYMAPERTMPEAEVDTRSDMYGLGATCYALLTGRAPASGKSLPEMIENVRKKKPESPKEYQLAVDDNFQDVVMRMIEKDPTDRYQEPRQLITELERIGKFNSLSAS
jgi:serine/threonine protein kinase